MPRKRPTVLEPHGRPRKAIDWAVVDELLEAGCLATEVAAHIGISTDTLYDRCREENGVLFTAYRQERQAKGDAALRVAMHKAALAGDNNTMKVWLSKQRLGMTDKHEASITTNTPTVLIVEGVDNDKL